jgi:sigma-B regulation protein RsbU (phosphoserine phosphatase)
MSSPPLPLSYRYQQALVPLVRRLNDPALAKRLSELLALVDFSTTLNRSLDLGEILDLVLFIAMGETAANWAALALVAEGGGLRLSARRGARGVRLPESCALPSAGDSRGSLAPGDPSLGAAEAELLAQWSAALLVPLRKEARVIGLLALGPRAGGYGEWERAFVEALAVAAAASIDNGRIYEEMRRLNNHLQLKVYQQNSLFDITRELHSAREGTEVRQVLLASAMGQLLATRCALVKEGRLVSFRGLKPRPDTAREAFGALGGLAELAAPTRLSGLPPPLRELLESWGLEVAVPLRAGSARFETLLVGGKASAQPVTEEELDFLATLAAQAAAALDNLRLTAEWVEKQKIEKELAMAREFQRALLPDSDPSLGEGWEVTGVNIPCLTVGGDYYDYVESSGRRIGLAIADVSGKGTGPALLMASAQASLRVLSQEDQPLPQVFCRLNALLYRSTEPNRYVTFFYGLLDPSSGELSYVNAGHCLPLLLRREGMVERLARGGPVLGLLPDVAFETGQTTLDPGDLLVLYTDGLSEIRSPAEEEFGEARIIERARAASARPAREVVGELVGAARAFAAGAGLSDDLTVVVVKRT